MHPRSIKHVSDTGTSPLSKHPCNIDPSPWVEFKAMERHDKVGHDKARIMFELGRQSFHH